MAAPSLASILVKLPEPKEGVIHVLQKKGVRVSLEQVVSTFADADSDVHFHDSLSVADTFIHAAAWLRMLPEWLGEH